MTTTNVIRVARHIAGHKWVDGRQVPVFMFTSYVTTKMVTDRCVLTSTDRAAVIAAAREAAIRMTY